MFWDEEELETKYKPAVVDNIKLNARSFIDPVKKVRVYEDTRYSSEALQKDELREERKRKVSREFTDKPQAKKKTSEARFEFSDTQNCNTRQFLNTKDLEKTRYGIPSSISSPNPQRSQPWHCRSLRCLISCRRKYPGYKTSSS